MRNVEISVIVPVYKVENYLVKCIDSILCQTFNLFELILVDDGSPDNCGVICEQYTQQDERVRVIHQTNSGVTIARKRGVEIAIGKFICFVDADDILPKLSLQTLYDFAIHNRLDVAMGAYMMITEDGNFIKELHYPEGVYSGIEFLEKLLETLPGPPWGALYSRKLFLPDVLDVPPVIKIGEDMIMKSRLILYANKVGVTPIVIYYYLQRPTSVIHTLKRTLETEKLFNKLLFYPPLRLALGEKCERLELISRYRSLRACLTDKFDPTDPWLLEMQEVTYRLHFPWKRCFLLFLCTNSFARYVILFAHRYHLKNRLLACFGIRNV